MNIKEIIDKERWYKSNVDNYLLTPFDWRYLHGFSLDRIEDAMTRHISELEHLINQTYSVQTKQADRIAELEALLYEADNLVRTDYDDEIQFHEDARKLLTNRE